MKEFGWLNLLAPQVFSPEEENRAIRNTMTCDWSFGHRGVVEDFGHRFDRFGDHVTWLKGLPPSNLEAAVVEARRASVLITAVMLTGECNADCGVCYTSRRKKRGELTAPEIIEIAEQTRRLGSRTLYVAGEGEPLLDPAFFAILDYVKRADMRLLFFTNGILLSNDDAARKRWGMTSRQIAERIADAPAWVYHKLWSMNPDVTSALMGLPRSKETYRYVEWTLASGATVAIPAGLHLLLDLLPRERLGIETLVERRTADEVAERIVPFVEQTGVRSYVEPIIHSGRNFGRHDFDPTPAQVARLGPNLVRQGCTRVAYKFAVHNDGYATPGISIHSSHLHDVEGHVELSIRAVDGGVKDVFALRHSHPFLVANRYRIDGCLCENLNLELAAQSCRTPCAPSKAAHHGPATASILPVLSLGGPEAR